jgi:NAD(P)-dependent dehydrogenase (short-subunit alcohol dehydrogenase family)
MQTMDMTGKVVVVTGATSGIGKAAAFELARMGATIGVVARSKERGEAVVADIRSRAGNSNVHLFLADLSSQQQVRRLAREIEERFDSLKPAGRSLKPAGRRLDVLINNAGAIHLQRTVTEDGIETTFAVNHLAYFLLTILLLPLLQKSAPARVVNVASDEANGAQIDFADLGGERKYSGWRAYGQSKLANILFTAELARRLEGTGVTVNALHPGTVATGFNRNNGPLMRLGMAIAGLFMKKPEQGADTVVYLATSPEVEGVSGKYFYQRREVVPPAASQDEATAHKLWQVSERLVG